ncbi:hypothetical protein BDB01DRAFT_839405 [Pilobolus umbonatus]|nr:hypothetical protein BDB01DRAFT_839405 [Pilobolus umbonatus]
MSVLYNNNWESYLSQQERQAYREIFNKIDADTKGVVLQEETMNYLKNYSIPQNIMDQLWQRVDDDNKGFLTDKELFTLLKLIACAQRGVLPADNILSTEVGLPLTNSQPLTPKMNSLNAPTSPRMGSDVISKENRANYIRIFQSLGPVDNVLPADKAQTFFLRSRLPSTVLQNIWQLADTRHTGQLNQTEFVIAMHYIEQMRKGQGQLPPTLPPTIYTSATGRVIPSSPLVRNNTQFSSFVRSPVFQGATVAPSDISPEEYRKYKVFFDKLDTDHTGYISGPDAVVFFKHSKLPDSDLARIWDIADTNSTGKLNEKEFATAMHIINRRLAGGDISAVAVPRVEQGNFDLLGLDSEPTPGNIHSTLDSNIQAEKDRVSALNNQINQEQQSNQTLQSQIESQKQQLNKYRQEAEEAEKKLEALKKRKEELMKELQMYRQEKGHYDTRIEHAKEETKKVQEEVKGLESEVFSLSSSAPPTSLFAKVDRSLTPSQMDVSDIESKFPDLSTMENNFSMPPETPTHDNDASKPNNDDLFSTGTPKMSNTFTGTPKMSNAFTDTPKMSNAFTGTPKMSNAFTGTPKMTFTSAPNTSNTNAFASTPSTSNTNAFASTPSTSNNNAFATHPMLSQIHPK